MIQKRKSKKSYLIALSIFWFISLMILNPFDQNKIAYRSYDIELGSGKNGWTPPITQDSEIIQTFTARKNGMNAVSLSIATLGRTNTAIFEISILTEDGGKLLSEIVDTADWSETEKRRFEFDTIKDSKGKKYNIVIKGIEGTIDDSPAMYTTSYVYDEEEMIVVNGEKQDYTLVMEAFYEAESLFYVYIAAWMIVIVLSFVFALKASVPDERTFVLFSICLGGLFIVLNPFVHFIDESTHFFRSLAISRGYWCDIIKESQIGAEMPVNYATVINTKLSIKNFIETPQLWVSSFSSESSFYTNPYMSSVIPINHMLAALPLYIVNRLELPIIVAILSGRIFTFAVYVTVCYCAIKNATYYKTVYYVVATLPVSQWLAASFSMDPILLACALLFVSICLKYRFADTDINISKWDIIALISCGVFIASVKYCVYVPILLLFFVIPRKCFSKKQYCGMISAAVFVVLIMVIWQVILLKMFPFTEDRNGYVNVGEQLKFMLDNIGYTIRNFTNYFVNSIFYHMTNLLYLPVLPNISAVLGICVLFSSVITPDKYIFKEPKKQKNLLVLFIFVALIVYFLQIVALYCGFTPVGLFDVQGLQPRYILPILVLVLISMAFNKIKNESSSYSSLLIFITEASIILNLLGCINDSFS